MTATTVIARLSASCAAAGFDVVFPFGTRAWTDRAHRLPLDDGRNLLGVVIGNSRALWPHVRDACAGDEQHPIDAHTERVLTRAVEDACAGRAHAVVWAHTTSPAFPVQRLAAAVGLATVSPSHLAIHATLGPWWALRAVLVVDVPGPMGVKRAPDPCTPCDKPCLAPFERAQASGTWRDWLAVRDACPVAREQRYDDAQVRYHYGTAFGLCE